MFALIESFSWNSEETKEKSEQEKRRQAWNLVHSESEIHLYALNDLVLAALYGLFSPGRMSEILSGIAYKDPSQIINHFTDYKRQWQTSEYLRLTVYKALADQAENTGQLLGHLYDNDSRLQENPEELREFAN